MVRSGCEAAAHLRDQEATDLLHILRAAAHSCHSEGALEQTAIQRRAEKRRIAIHHSADRLPIRQIRCQSGRTHRLWWVDHTHTRWSYVLMYICIDINPLQMLREVVAKYNLTADDILHRIKMRYYDQPINFNAFKDCLLYLDHTLTQLQIKNLFDLLKNAD